MHWVIQKRIFKPENYRLLVNTLNALDIRYTPVSIPRGTFDLVPNIAPSGPVYVCGAIKLRRISEERLWKPGSFLNDNFNFDRWIAALGPDLLNTNIVKGKLKDIPIDTCSNFFIRPLEDNKTFDGTVIDSEMLEIWRKDSSKANLSEVDVIIASPKEIYREYRIFVVNRKVITGSLYKVRGEPQISELIDPDVIEYAEHIIRKWLPSESCVIDICLSKAGLQVIEFNNINSSGFYAINIQKYVEAIQREYR